MTVIRSLEKTKTAKVHRTPISLKIKEALHPAMAVLRYADALTYYGPQGVSSRQIKIDKAYLICYFNRLIGFGTDAE
jgi:hypothetical protein